MTSTYVTVAIWSGIVTALCVYVYLKYDGGEQPPEDKDPNTYMFYKDKYGDRDD